MKTTGATVTEFGLKVAQSVGDVVGKTADFIPGLGKSAEQAIDQILSAAGTASDTIPAHLSSKLQEEVFLGRGIYQSGRVFSDGITVMCIISRSLIRTISQWNIYMKKDSISMMSIYLN
jgi:hypothetical protein